jgi:beta-galactosidase/beta-glucuronidase
MFHKLNNMMKKYLVFLLAAIILQSNFALAQNKNWKMVEGKIASPWAANINPATPLPEYPRPQMFRDNWQNLNGLWDYSIVPKGQQENIPSSFGGKILVPFAIESSLSGVGKTDGKDSVLWYRKTVNVPARLRKQNVLLHFGAVDWLCDVYVNGKKAGSHRGGYDPFYFDVTALLNKGNQQEISLMVWDPTDDGPQARGKQVKKPEGIWYTPVTGIWQTVWLESVPATYVIETRQTPDIDNNLLKVSANVFNAQANVRIRVSAWEGKTRIAEKEVAQNEEAQLEIANQKLWTPDNPHLYDLRVAIVRNGRIVDEVKSYFGMRKISIEPDKNGIQRMLLNNEFVFQYGPLDQGWWPDGLFTAPTDEALRFDIEKTKEMGFNMIRKHVKVEPARWYTHCDRLGIFGLAGYAQRGYGQPLGIQARDHR